MGEARNRATIDALVVAINARDIGAIAVRTTRSNS